MANYASLRGPVGLTRVYASIPKGATGTAPWFDSLKKGRTFATNGPLLGFTLGGKAVGEELKLPAGENKVMFTSWLRSFVPVDHFEVVCNGHVVRDLKPSGDRQSTDVKEYDPDFADRMVCTASVQRPDRSIRCLTTMSMPPRARFT